MASLSSHDSGMRSLGCTVLSRIHSHIQKAKKALSAEKQIWTHLIDVVRNGLQSTSSLEGGGVVKRVPSVVTTFLVKACTILHSPLDPLYRPISSFVLAKPAELKLSINGTILESDVVSDLKSSQRRNSSDAAFDNLYDE